MFAGKRDVYYDGFVLSLPFVNFFMGRSSAFI